VVAAYAIAPTWLLSHLLGFDLLALPVLAGAAASTLKPREPLYSRLGSQG